jgi:hypothetical protein
MKIIGFAFSDVSELLISFRAVNEQHIFHCIREFGS